jgi:hypothetical protein
MTAYLREKKQLRYPTQPLRGLDGTGDAALLIGAAALNLAWTGLAFYGLFTLLEKRKKRKA